MAILKPSSPIKTVDLIMEDGAVIRIRQHGNLDGMRLILAHGNGFATDAYFPFWSLLEDRYELILYDQRNHGHNPLHDDKSHHDVPYFVSDLETVFQGIKTFYGPKPTAGLFHSISAITAVWHALSIGWHWDALILFDPPLVPSPQHPLHEIAKNFELMLAEWAKNRQSRFPDPKTLEMQFAKSRTLSRWVTGAHRLMAQSILRKKKNSSDWVLCCPPEREAQIYKTNSELNLCRQLVNLKGPLQVIASAPNAPKARAPGLVNQALHQEFGHRYEAVSGTTHMVQIEKPIECENIVSRFLKEINFGE